MTDTARLNLWHRLQEAQLVPGDPPSAAAAETPWYVRALLGVSGWIAAAFILGFIGVFVVNDTAGSFVVGVAMVGGAFVIFRTMGRSDFATQFALAMSFAGQALVVFAVFRIGRGESASTAGRWLFIAAFEAVVAWLLPNSVHRVWSAFAAAMSLACALTVAGAYYLSPGLIAAGVAAVWLNEFAWARRASLVRAVGYGLTLALIVVQGTFFSNSLVFDLLLRSRRPEPWPLWVSALLPTIALTVVVWRLLARPRPAVSPTTIVGALVAAAVIGAVSFKAPGIATGLMIVLLGFANGSRTLLGLGIFAMLAYISAYYYLLESTLLVKSEALALVGAVLIAVQWICTRWFFPAEEAGHA